MQQGQAVSVIITTKNEEDIIGRLIKSVKKQTFKKIEIILVDNNSDDKTVEISKKIGVKVVNYGPERSAQRNYGAKIAQGDYLLFLDADMELSKDVVKECVRTLETDERNSSSDKKIGALTILEKSIARTFWEKAKAFERSFYNEEGDEITDAARFFPKVIFDKASGYDESITGPEDWDLTDRIKKMGYKIGVVSKIIYHYERISSVNNLLKKKFYYGLKSYRYFSKHKQSLISSKTIYFLRPVFYKRIDRILKHPILSLGMIAMMLLEIMAGGSGYLYGRIKKL